MICKLLSLKSLQDDILKNLFSNYNDIENFLGYLNENNINNQNIPKQLYSYKKRIEDILYNEDIIIKIDKYKININDISNLYYLDLLISDNKDLINYSYSIDFIKNIYESNENSKDIKKLIIFKILIDLINEYKNIYCNEKELNYIDKMSMNIIKNNIHALKEYNINITINELISKRIDEIYEIIIKSLIENIEKNDFEKTCNLCNQFGFDKIDISNEMHLDILKFLDENNSNDITLSNKEDIFKNKNINLFYILLKFIFKNNYYIYNAPFLLKARKLFISLIKSKQIKYNEIDNSKLKYIIEKIVDSKYYLKNNKETDYKQLEEILKYYKTIYFKSKKEDIKIIEDIIKNKKGEYDKYLKDYKEALEINEKIEIIDYIYDLKNTEKEAEIKKIIDSWKKIESMLIDKKVKKVRSNIKKKIISYFSNNKEKIIKLYNEVIYNYVINDLNSNEKKKEKIKNENIEENEGDQKNENIKKNEIVQKNKIIQKNENMINIGEDPPPLVDKPHDENEKGKNSKENSKVENSYDSTNQTSLSNEKNTSINSKKNEVPQNKGDSAPLPIMNISNDISNILYNILIFSSINITVEMENEKYYTSFEEITYGKKNNTKIDANKFKESLRINKESKKDDYLTKNCKLFIVFLDEFMSRIVNEYKNNFKLKIKLELEKEEKNIDDIFNITCKYIFFEPINNKPHSFIEENILINRTNSLTVGFQFLIYEINNECYGIHPQKNDINLNNQVLIGINENSNKNSQNILIESNERNKIADEDIIIELIKILDKDGYYNGNIKEFDNGYYTYWRDDNTIVICDSNCDIIMEIKESIDLITNTNERANYDGKKKNSIQLIVSGSKDIILLIIDLNNLKYEIKGYSLSNMYSLNISEMKKNNYIIAGKKNCIHTIDLFVHNQIKQNRIDDKTYLGAYRISDNIIALSSNSLLPGGENSILFYNTNTKKTTNGMDGFSPIISCSGLSLISREIIIANDKNKKKKTKNNKILLCACKSYLQEQKNGILIINANLGDNQKIEEPFYATDNYEVNCFCPISIITNKNKDYKNIDDEYKKNIQIKDTDFFFVGGFDIDKREGIIKLYKVYFGEKAINTKIEYLQDIETDIIDSPINCIIQSKISGNILVTSYSGNIYLFTKPNIDYYLNQENF